MFVKDSCTALVVFSVLSISASIPLHASNEIRDVEQFRDIFAGMLSDSKSDSDLDKLIYYPNRSLLEPPQLVQSSAEQFFNTLQIRLSNLNPLELYKEGLSHPFHAISKTESEAAMRKLNRGEDLMTIVVVPGIFGEFIATHAFEEVFHGPSSYRDEFVRHVQTRSGSVASTDQRYSLHALSFSPASLTSLFEVGTLTDNRQTPLANVILFNTGEMSLESMGDIDEISKIFSRRLSKFFSLMGTPSKLLFVGYSRGGMVGLDMFSKAAQSSAPWLSHVMGLVALGGVTYGSDLADVAFGDKKPGNVLAEQLTALKSLRSKLKTVPPTFLAPQVLAENTEAWNEFFFQMIRLNNPGLLTHEGLSPSEIKTEMSSLAEQFKSEMSINMKAITAMAVDIGCKNFETLDQAHYNQNIERFDRFVDSALIAVKQLTTKERLTWWRTHTIPTGSSQHSIRYYSVAATMADPQSTNPEEKALALNPVSYNPALPDFGSLVKNYLQFKDYTGLQVNDSQMAAQKVRFWPEAAPLLNPAQAPYDARFLGLLGVHHWGLALEIVTAVKSGAKDPFPRVALLKSVAAKAASDE